MGSKRLIFIVGLISFLNALTLGAIIPVIYTYASSFDLNDASIGVLFATFSLAQFFATPVIGRLSDKYGRKPLLVISLSGTFVASLIQAFATSGWMLFLGRFLDGITGGNNSVAQAVIVDSVEEKDKPFGFAVFGAGFGLGFLVGPVISLFISKIGNSYVFLFSALLALVTTLIALFVLPETNLNRETKPLNFVEVLFLEIFRAMKMPIIRDILLINFITALSTAIFQIAFQPYITVNFGYGQDHISYVLILNGVISIAFLGFVKRLSDKFGLNNLLRLTFLIRFLTFLVLAVIVNKLIFWIVMVVFGFINLFSRPVISTMISNYSKKEDQGTVIGVAESMFSLGLIIGPSLFSLTSLPQNSGFSLGSQTLTNLLINSANNYTLAFYLMAVISLCAFVYVLRFTAIVGKMFSIHRKEIDF